MRTKLDRIPILLALALIFVVGCGDDRSSIRRYQVPHEETVSTAVTQTPTTTQRTIAAIVPSGDQAWFFKATGPSDRIQAAAGDFAKLVRSVRFEGDRPQWDVPEGWSEIPGGQFRFATLRKETTEISISKLPLPDGDLDGYVLANINRWRGQISLPPVTQSELPKITQRIELTDRAAIIYDSGPTSDPSATPPRPQTQPSPQAQPSSPVTYDVPDGWQQEGRRPMRLATFTVERDDKKVEIVVSQLGPNAGTLVANVNRWRGQIGLSEAEEADIMNDLRKLDVDGSATDYIQIVAAENERVIFAVIVKRPDLTLFVKLTGDRAVAEAETSNFEKFARSIRFSS